MSFINQRLPQQVEIGAVRRVRAFHDVVKTDGGFEVRNARHAWDSFEYEISFAVGEFEDSVISEVYDFVMASRVGLIPFRFRDWDTKNNTLTAEVIGTGDTVEDTFQIKKTWTVGGISSVRNITRPVSPMSVYLNAVLQSSGYTIDYDTGIITFTSPPGSGVAISVTGNYDIPVRFDFSYGATGETGWLEHIDTLTLVEVKE